MNVTRTLHRCYANVTSMLHEHCVSIFAKLSLVYSITNFSLLYFITIKCWATSTVPIYHCMLRRCYTDIVLTFLQSFYLYFYTYSITNIFQLYFIVIKFLSHIYCTYLLLYVTQMLHKHCVDIFTKFLLVPICYCMLYGCYTDLILMFLQNFHLTCSIANFSYYIL